MAYEFCIKSPKETSSAQPISALVLNCKKTKWDIRERDRLRRRNELLGELEEKLDQDRKAELADLNEAAERGEVGKVEAEEERARINSNAEQKISDLRTSFAISDPAHLEKREVPDYLVDTISFEIMHDPVITKNGNSYERATIIEHLKRSPTDPLTRESLTVAELRPNIALRQACTEFMEHNKGWVYDW